MRLKAAYEHPRASELLRPSGTGFPVLAVYGTWQCHGEVRHLVGQRLADMSHLLGSWITASRNFC
ncbi:hypothetical protein F6X42_06890 [Paraburkholderia sp. WC7.3b]|uniref:Uncharacterized protein n=1 Tax=Paraburkholderia podalyriae TaxID=1938811 RepID=A0ABR7PJ60_9BURK|nr:hypothetical protein [Paraburkholderia podalyriae]